MTHDIGNTCGEESAAIQVAYTKENSDDWPRRAYVGSVGFKLKLEDNKLVQTDMNDELLFTLTGSPIDSITTVCGQGIVSYYDTTGVWYHLVEE